MEKSSRGFVAIAVILLFISATAHPQEDLKYVDNSVFAGAQKTPSKFDHDRHNETADIEDCAECHHIYEDGQKLEGESSEDQRCSDCHELKGENGYPRLRTAYHQNCKGCHIRQGKGPIACGECHLR